MDDTPQNDPGFQQKPADENKYDYQQYLGPEGGSSKNRRKFMIVGLTGLFIILIAATAIILLIGGKKSGQSGQSQTPVAAMCRDESCLEQNFAQCLPAEYTADAGDISKIKYTITGPADVGCNTQAEYLANKYIPEFVGKKMTCEFDNTIDFPVAVKNAFLYPDAYNCQGDLVSAISGLDNTAGP